MLLLGAGVGCDVSARYAKVERLRIVDSQEPGWYRGEFRPYT